MNEETNRLIRTQEEFDLYGEEARKRQFEPNPIKIDLTNIPSFWGNTDFDWDKEYLEIIREDNVDVFYLKQYIYEQTNKR